MSASCYGQGRLITAPCWNMCTHLEKQRPHFFQSIMKHIVFFLFNEIKTTLTRHDIIFQQAFLILYLCAVCSCCNFTFWFSNSGHLTTHHIITTIRQRYNEQPKLWTQHIWINSFQKVFVYQILNPMCLVNKIWKEFKRPSGMFYGTYWSLQVWLFAHHLNIVQMGKVLISSWPLS